VKGASRFLLTVDRPIIRQRPTDRLPSGYRGDPVTEFGILGPLEVRRDGVELPLGGRNHRAVLALLLLEAGRVVSIDRIAEELYAGDTPVTAVTQVHRQVSELRRILDAPDTEQGQSAIETRAPGYVIHVDADRYDLYRFEQLCASAEQAFDTEDAGAAVQALDEALALWRGEPLADLVTESFAQRPIGRLEELRDRALERRVEARLALGRHADVIPELSALAAAAPLRERRHELLMLALYRSGRQVDALDVYSRTRAMLVETFGVEPGPELQRIQQAILRHDPELAAPGSAASLSDRAGAVLVAGHGLESVRGLAALGGPLARPPGLELIVALLLPDESELTAATTALADERAQSTVSMRVAAFVANREADDLMRLARSYDARLLLVEAPPAFASGGAPPEELVALLARSPADVAVVAPGSGEPGGGVLVPFAGGEHDWAALELGAWLATATSTPLRLAGTRHDASGRDASALLADASIAVQRLAGVVAEPVLIEPTPTGLTEAAAGAAAVVVGLSSRWRREGLGEARSSLVAAGGPPVLAVHRGPQPSGIAPREAQTRFTWSVGVS
jgi:DNA-binding SARP family transcriptional activator